LSDPVSIGKNAAKHTMYSSGKRFLTGPECSSGGELLEATRRILAAFVQGNPPDGSAFSSTGGERGAAFLERHQIAAVVHAAFPPDVTPSSFLQEAASRTRQICRDCVRNETAILELFAEARLPIALLRGLDVAVRLYGDPLLRPRSDVDVLVPRRARSDAINLLLRQGFVPDLGASRDQVERLSSFRSSYLFIAGDGSCAVDLHWEAAEGPWRFYTDAEEVWRRCRPVRHGQLQFRGLCREDLLLHLCLHAGQHAWDRLLLLTDIALLVCRHAADMDWAGLQKRIGRLGLAHPVTTALHLVEWLLEPASLPLPVRQLVRPAASRPARAAILIRRNWSKPPAGRLVRWKVQLSSLSLRRWPTWAAWVLLSPTILEIGRWDLPRCLHPLYPLLRCLRLAAKYSVGTLRRRPAPSGTPSTARAELLASLLAEGKKVRLVVHGRSMGSALPDGSEILVEPPQGVDPGDLVLYRNPAGDLRIHRLAALDLARGRALVKADASSDTVEAIPQSAVIGKVKLRGHARDPGTSPAGGRSQDPNTPAQRAPQEGHSPRGPT